MTTLGYAKGRRCSRPTTKSSNSDTGWGGHSLRNVWYHDTARAGQSAKEAHRQKRMTVKASSYIASIEAAAPALAVQAIIKMPFRTTVKALPGSSLEW